MKLFFAAGFVLFLVVVFCYAGPVSAQSATSTLGYATSTIAVAPEWSNDQQTDIYIWGKTAAALIRAGVGQLAAVATQNLAIPVLFGVAPSDLVLNYGDPRGSGRFHEGEDIIAPKGAPIVSPTPAVVLSSSFGPDSGYYVTTANPGGETFVYMHLDHQSALTSGTVLPAGSLVGFVGNTGNASGGAAHLHFEIRKNGATNPFVRLKSEFSLAQKMAFLTTILSQSSDKASLAKFIVNTYPSQIAAARAANITMPAEIISQIPAVLPAVAGASTSSLVVGSRGQDVVNLQTFLILQNKGPAAIKLAGTGATGYFGALTRDALAEYQSLAGVAVTAKLTREQILSKIAQIQSLILSLQEQLRQLQAGV